MQAFAYMNMLHSFLRRWTKHIWQTKNEFMCVRNPTFFFISRKWCITWFPFFQDQYLEALMDYLFCVRNNSLVSIGWEYTAMSVNCMLQFSCQGYNFSTLMIWLHNFRTINKRTGPMQRRYLGFLVFSSFVDGRAEEFVIDGVL